VFYVLILWIAPTRLAYTVANCVCNRPKRAMSLIRLENISKSFTGETIISGVDFRVEEGEKVGLIGRNGTGKSTLFRVMTGEVVPDTGLVDRKKKARMACLAQFPDVDKSESIHDIALSQFTELINMEQRLRDLEHQMAEGSDEALEEYSELQDAFSLTGGYEFRSNVDRVLTGLGFTEADFNLPVSALSGGQRTRLMLALVLLQDADLLLLDEPENHLDLEAREWLEKFLSDWPRAFVIISHDRQMLNAVAKRIVEVEDGGVVSYTGNYDQFVAAKELRLEQQQEAYERQQKHIEKEEALINRFRYKASKAKFAQSRIKKLDKMEKVDAPKAGKKSAKFGLGEVQRSGAVVLEARDLAMGYHNLPLYDRVSFQVERGERVGIIGPNGTGKSTLLRHLAGELPEGTGEVKLGHKVQLGFYDQHHEDLNPGNDILTEIGDLRPDMKPEEIRTFMGRFLFTGEDTFKPVTALSGGERARVSIAKLILEGANVLLLDEPTNHLDIASREALEGALAGYEGSIIMVSHDRALIDRLVEKLIIVEDGHATVHLGNYTHYRWKTRGESKKDDQVDDSVMRIRKTKEAEKNRGRESEKDKRRKRKKLQELEEQIEAMEQHIESYDQRFNSVDPSDYTELQRLQADVDGLKNDLKEMYTEWERLSEEVG